MAELKDGVVMGRFNKRAVNAFFVYNILIHIVILYNNVLNNYQNVGNTRQ